MKTCFLSTVAVLAACAQSASIGSFGEQLKTVRSESGRHAIRFKQPTSLNIDTVQQYSGYLDVDDKDHFFFWFFESRSDPAHDPVVLWLNGGPGCSSLSGLLFENGPSTLVGDNGTTPERNEFSWNSKANVIYLDQPVNVGYSYSDEQVDMTVPAERDVYEFLSLFFEQFTEYNSDDFHVFGESYGGHYIPALGAEILSHPDSNFHLKSIGMGDPLVSLGAQTPGVYNISLEAGVPQSGLDYILDNLPQCQQQSQACYDSNYDTQTCQQATDICNSLSGPYEDTGGNVYDIRKPCLGGDLCYEGLNTVQAYFNEDSVKTALGANVSSFQDCSNSVSSSFYSTSDPSVSMIGNVTTILEAGIPVLVYAGDKDFICNWYGQVLWMQGMEWSGQSSFNSAAPSDFTLSGSTVGQVTSSYGLTFFKVHDAGHMVPHDQPQVALEMLTRWLDGNTQLLNN